MRENPEFSWSVARDDMMNRCPREYYYHYYGSHNGWMDANINKKTYALKNLTSLYFEFTDSVKKHMAEFIKEYNITLVKEDLARPDLSELVREDLHKVCLESATVGDWLNSPKRNKMFIEKYYMGGFKSELGQIISNSIKKRLDVLNDVYTTKTFKDIFEGVDKFHEVFENPFSSDKGKFYSKKHNETIYCNLDLVYKKNGITYGVLFNFSNKPDKDSYFIKQAMVGAKYIHKMYKAPFHKIVIRNEFVVMGFETENTFTSESFVDDIIDKSIGKMKEYIEGYDTKKNKAVFSEDFKRCVSKNCTFCHFREVCANDLK